MTTSHSRIISLHIDLLLPQMNEMIRKDRGSSFKSNKIKKKVCRDIALIAQSQTRERGFKYFDIVCYWSRKKNTTDTYPDRDNTEAGIKYLQDALQQAGIIENDGYRRWVQHRHLRPSPNGYVKVTLYELEVKDGEQMFDWWLQCESGEHPQRSPFQDFG